MKEEAAADSRSGTVEWFDPSTGVGSIRPDDGGPPCRVAGDALRDCGIESVAVGDRVRFRVTDRDGTPTARDLSVIRGIDRWENEGGANPDTPL